MAAPTQGPCTLWTTAADLEECPEQIPAAATADDIALAAQLASQLLWRYSGRQFGGLCQSVYRPCAGVNCGMDGGFLGGAGYWWYGAFGGCWPAIPVHGLDGWRNLPCGNGGCWLPCVHLAGPVSEIQQVLVDGVALPSTAYKVSGFQQLCRVDGDQWPAGQDMALPATEPGTFQVTYLRGTPPDEVASRMARIFALRLLPEIICGAGDSCRSIDEGITSISADGVSISYGDVGAMSAQGLTGIPVVDRWLRAVNPYGRKRRARIGRADNPARHGRVWT